MRLALGTAQLGLVYGVANTQGRVPADEARAILEWAQASGVETLDTAIAYGDSEKRLGTIGVQGWQVVSKLPAIPDTCDGISAWVKTAVRESLARLGIESLYGLLLHRPQQLLQQHGAELHRALLQLKHSGLVQGIGVSIYDPCELDALCSRYQFDLVQAPLNILDRRMIHSGWLQRLADQDIEVHARSVFLQGLLLMEPSTRPAGFARWASVWSAWESWLAQTGLTPLQACLRYALSWPQLSKVIVGVDSLRQLQEIFAAAIGPLPPVPRELAAADQGLLHPSNWVSLSPQSP